MQMSSRSIPIQYNREICADIYSKIQPHVKSTYDVYISQSILMQQFQDQRLAIAS
jgi:hypothetical protein